jgi:DNA-binding XRE family transcriptional regulator/quercetin dioxygenase-like cupin family protein
METIHEHAEREMRSLGQRLHAMRESRSWTLETLADLTQLSKAYLSRLEAGDRQPSMTALCAIASAFGISISQLFERPDESTNCVIMRGGSATPKMANGLVFTPLSGSTKSFNLQPIQVAIPADRAGSETYQHDGEEWLHVISGRVLLRVNDKTYELEPGDSAQFDSRLSHRLEAMDDREAQVILVACAIPVGLNARRETMLTAAGFAG